MSNQEPVADDQPPKWFVKWWGDEKQRRAKHELHDLGRDFLMLGLGILAVGITLATVPGVDTSGVLRIIAAGIAALVIGILPL
jgi:hypothetical protein